MLNKPTIGRVLIIDDEITAAENLAHVCRKIGLQVVTQSDPVKAMACVKMDTFDLVLTDLRMKSMDGMAVLSQVKRIDPLTAVVLITGYASFDSAVAAMKAGAFHYIAKPYRLNEVREVVSKALEMVFLKRENKQLKQQLQQNDSLIITQDTGMLSLLETARQIATTTTKVLITGQSGTGKELLARYIHQHSERRQKIFQAVNCGALQEDLLANELFGHVKGAYTGATDGRKGLIESSSGGTLFLDEIAEMSLGMQVTLLRVLQENEVQRVGSTTTTSVDIRLLTATHRDLRKEVEAGRFRQDLYYRLDVVNLDLPPLMQRRDDIPLLAFHFVRKHALRMNHSVNDISPETLDYLLSYPYPGNIRELENIIERAVTLAKTEVILPIDLPSLLLNEKSPHIDPEMAELPSLAQREVEYIQFVLDKYEQNKTQTAKVLGIDRVSLWRKLKRYGLGE